MLDKESLKYVLIIVVLIIGVLIAEVTQGSRLVAQAKLKMARGQTSSSPVAGIKDLAFWLEATSENSFVADCYLQGRIGELIVFSRGLKNEERKSITSYLAAKWGITIT